MADNNTFPDDIWCEILKSQPITLDDLLAIRGTSLTMYDIAMKCVKHLSGPVDDPISGSFVNSLETVEIIEDMYPIYVEDLQVFYLLAHHPTLYQASFDLSTVTTRDTFYGTVADFIEEKFNISTNNLCQCQTPVTFDYFFTDGIISLSITNHTIVVGYTDAQVINRLGKSRFLSAISQRLPICNYIGPINDTIVTSLRNYPCLITLDITPNETTFYDITIPLLPHLQELSVFLQDVSWEDSADYYSKIGFFFYQLQNGPQSNAQFPSITKLPPLPALQIPLVRRYFPNLKTIELIIYSLSDAIYQPESLRDLVHYDQIIIRHLGYQEMTDQQAINILPIGVGDRAIVLP